MQNDLFIKFKHLINTNQLNHLYILNGNSTYSKLNLIHYIIDLFYHDHSLQTKQQFKNYNHPNITYLKANESAIKKEEILAMKEIASKTSLIKGPRFIIINDGAYLTDASANSLLKFFEEPDSANLYCFLLTKNTSMLLPTIISRAQVITLNSDSEDFVINNLINNHQFEFDNAYILNALYEDYDEALLYKDEAIFKDFLDVINKFLPLLLDPKTIFLNQSPLKGIFTTNKNFFINLNTILLRIFLEIKKMHLNKNYQPKFKHELLKKLFLVYTLRNIDDLISFFSELTITSKLALNFELVYTTMILKLELPGRDL